MLEINNCKFKIKENVSLQKIEELDKYWAFDIENGGYYTLNETSYWILEQMLEFRTIAEIFKLFLLGYEVDVQKAEKDFLEILNYFNLNNLIEGGKDERNKKEAVQ